MKSLSMALLSLMLLGFVSCGGPNDGPTPRFHGKWIIRNIHVQTYDTATNGSLFDSSYVEYTDPDTIANQVDYEWDFFNSREILSTKTIDGVTTKDTFLWSNFDPSDPEDKLKVQFDASDSSSIRKFTFKLWFGNGGTKGVLHQDPIYTQKIINGAPLTLKTVRNIEMFKNSIW
jgi:hypothetical protein